MASEEYTEITDSLHLVCGCTKNIVSNREVENPTQNGWSYH